MRLMKNCYFLNEGFSKAVSNEIEQDTCSFHLFGCYDDNRLLCSSSGGRRQSLVVVIASLCRFLYSKYYLISHGW